MNSYALPVALLFGVTLQVAVMQSSITGMKIGTNLSMNERREMYRERRRLCATQSNMPKDRGNGAGTVRAAHNSTKAELEEQYPNLYLNVPRFLIDAPKMYCSMTRFEQSCLKGCCLKYVVEKKATLINEALNGRIPTPVINMILTYNNDDKELVQKLIAIKESMDSGLNLRRSLQLLTKGTADE